MTRRAPRTSGLAVGLTLALAMAGACDAKAPGSAPPRSVPKHHEVTVGAPPPKLVESTDALGNDAGRVDAAEPEDVAIARVPVALGPGPASCTLVFEASQASEADTHWTIVSIHRIRVEPGEGCVEAVLFDEERDRPTDPDEPSGPLEAALVPKPGKLDAFVAEMSDGPGSALVDVNFDGYLDLRVLRMSGNYTSTFRFWTYDPVSRAFASSLELDALFSPDFDASARTVSEGGRASGSMYFSATYQWIAGKLEPMTKVTTWLGEKPDGTPLPRGFHRWELRFGRKNGTYQRVFEGPVR